MSHLHIFNSNAVLFLPEYIPIEPTTTASKLFFSYQTRTRILTVHRPVTQVFASCQTAIAVRMVPRSPEVSVPEMVLATGSPRWSRSPLMMPSITITLTFMLKSSTNKERILMDVTSREHSTSHINILTTQLLEICTDLVMRLLPTPSLTTITRLSGQQQV